MTDMLYILFVLILSTINISYGVINRLPPGCKTSELDIVFLIDSSADVESSEFQESLKFVSDVVDTFDVSPLSVRISLAVYGSTIKALNFLQDIGNPSTNGTEYSIGLGKKDLKALLESATAVGGSRRTGKAIRYACDTIFGYANETNNDHGTGLRRSQKIIVTIASSYSQDDIPADLSCRPRRADQITDVTIIGIATTHRGIPIFGHKHVDVVLEGFTGYLFMEQVPLTRSICEVSPRRCPFAEQDILFVVDRSNTISMEDFRLIRSWIKDIIKSFSVTEQHTRVGLVQFSETVKTEFELTKHQTLEELLDAVDKISNTSFTSGETNIEDALQHAALNSFDFDKEDGRKHVRKTIILLTDGCSSKREAVKTAARDLHYGGVEIYAVGIGGKADKNQLGDVASSPDWNHVTLLRYFRELPRTAQIIVSRMCQSLFQLYPGAIIDLQIMVEYEYEEQQQTSVELVEQSSTYGYSTGERSVKAWIKSLVDSFHIGRTYTMVGMTMFGNTTQQSFEGRQYLTKDGVLEAIDLSNFTTSYTSVDWSSVFNQTYEAYFRSGARGDSTKVFVVFSHSAASAEFWKTIQYFSRVYGLNVFWMSYNSSDSVFWRYASTGGSTSGVWMMGKSSTGRHEDLRSIVLNVVQKIRDAAVPTCDGFELDLQFLIDGSSSIKSYNFDKVKDWVSSLVSSFDVGPYTTRIGAIQYSDEPNVEFNLNTYATKLSTLGAVKKIPYKEGRTSTGKAINFTLSNSFVPNAGSRKGVKKVLVVMTDGSSQDDVTASAKILHKSSNLQTYAIGVGEANLPQLQEIASSPDDIYLYKVEDFDEINTIRNSLFRSLCANVKEKGKIFCPSAEMDLYVLVDDSSAPPTSSEFQSLQIFIKNLAITFPIGPHAVRIATVLFSSVPRTAFSLSDNMNSETLQNAITIMGTVNIPHNYRTDVNLSSALLFVQNAIDDKDFGSRDGVEKVVLIIMSNPTDSNPEYAAGELAKNGVKIFGVSIGRTASLTQVENVITGPASDHFFAVPDWFSLEKLEPSLTRQVCNVSSTVCKNKFDIVFIVENSFSMDKTNFKHIMNFMANLARGLDVSYAGVHYSMVVNNDDTIGGSIRIKNFTNEENVGSAILDIPLHIGAVDVSQALDFAMDYGFLKEDGSRTNVRKIIVLITDGVGLIESDYITDTNELSDVGIQLIKIGIGEVQNEGYSDIGGIPEIIAYDSDTITVDSYYDLSGANSKVMRKVCRDAECPLFYWGKGTKSGMDFITSLDLREMADQWNLKTRKGLDDNSVSFKFNTRSRVSGLQSEIFPNGFPSKDFMIVVVLRMQKITFVEDVWNIIELTSSSGSPQFVITIDSPSQEISVSGGRESSETAVFSNAATRELFDRKWHKLQLMFSSNFIELYVDCEFAGRFPFQLSTQNSAYDSGTVQIGKLMSSKKSAGFDLQRMDLGCGLNADLASNLETCCELKGYFSEDCENKTPHPKKPKGPRHSTSTTAKPFEEYKSSTISNQLEGGVECRCEPGFPGPPGLPGIAGMKGDLGPSGLDGFRGPPGHKGEKGEKGEITVELPGSTSTGSVSVVQGRGLPGPQGAPGLPGPPGVPGRVIGGSVRGQKAQTWGVTDSRVVDQVARSVCMEIITNELPRMLVNLIEGQRLGLDLKGDRGDRGPPGESGYQGDTGLTGPPGTPGLPGIRGPQGPMGPRGLRGAKGEDGERGIAGVGTRGAPGPRGPMGYSGKTVHGKPGERGRTGLTGPQGKPGIAGSRGSPGVTGHCDTAYCYSAVYDWISRTGMMSRDSSIKG